MYGELRRIQKLIETDEALDDVVNSLIKDAELVPPLTVAEDVVKKLGGTVVIEDFNDVCEGRVMKLADDKFKIRITPFDAESNRKNYAIYLALAFLMMDFGFIVQQEEWRKQDSFEWLYQGWLETKMPIEYKVYFALALQMPRSMFIEKVEENTKDGTVDLKPIAEYFGVSCSSVSKRGKDIGILKDDWD
jgi:hypothetical protein